MSSIKLASAHSWRETLWGTFACPERFFISLRLAGPPQLLLKVHWQWRVTSAKSCFAHSSSQFINCSSSGESGTSALLCQAVYTLIAPAKLIPALDSLPGSLESLTVGTPAASRHLLCSSALPRELILITFPSHVLSLRLSNSPWGDFNKK